MRTLRSFAAASSAALALAGGLGACGGTAGHDEKVNVAPPASTPEPARRVGALQPVDGAVATARGELAVYAAPDDRAPVTTLAATTEFGSPTTLRVTAWDGPAGSWLKVLLPIRPNGSSGYVRTRAVTLGRFAHRIDVDLVARRLRVADASGTVVIDTAVAIGSPANPTPAGDFFVTDVIDTPDDGGAYGPYAIGLSAHSDTLTEFAGGDGNVGIHGTNDPASIGNAVSHGCIRVPNDVVAQLAHTLALGTPVTIR
jgi:lipoprotein-anchoring transpeptidase ErfK/SrfK